MSDDDVLLRRIEALSAELAKTKVERDHFYTQFQSAWAALTPRSEEEKRGLERVLAILKAKLSDGGGIVGPSDVQRAHNDFYRGRRLAFEEFGVLMSQRPNTDHVLRQKYGNTYWYYGFIRTA